MYISTKSIKMVNKSYGIPCPLALKQLFLDASDFPISDSGFQSRPDFLRLRIQSFKKRLAPAPLNLKKLLRLLGLFLKQLHLRLLLNVMISSNCSHHSMSWIKKQYRKSISKHVSDWKFWIQVWGILDETPVRVLWGSEVFCLLLRPFNNTGSDSGSDLTLGLRQFRVRAGSSLLRLQNPDINHRFACKYIMTHNY